MPAVATPTAPHVRLLLDALADPARSAALEPRQWDILVRTARVARLLGTLAARVEAAGALGRLPEAVANHLRAALAEARYLRQMTLRQLTVLADTLRPLAAPIVALKGSAYILAELSIAAGRMPRDVDLMVERRRLDEAERLLRAAGWEFSKTDEYDQRYYREWSHELPPMRAPVLPLELDLHHTILPPIGRLRPNAARLFADSVAVPGSEYRVLRPADQLLHAAVHLFQDSDCVGKLRDLVDIDGLAREYAQRHGDAFWDELAGAAEGHGLGRPLWYALAFASSWLATPVPAAAWERFERFRPPGLARWPLVALASRVLAPVHPDTEAGVGRRMAASALEFRALCLRMPPTTLAYHSANKFLRSWRGRPAAAAAEPQ